MFFVEPEIIHKKTHASGRRAGDTNNTPEERAAIGALTRIVGPSEAAEIFDVAPSSAHAYAKGQNGPCEVINPALKNAVDLRTRQVHDIALAKLLDTIDEIDIKKVRDEKPKIQSEIAKNLSSVVEKTKEGKSNINVGQVIIYAPVQRKSDEYDQVDV